MKSDTSHNSPTASKSNLILADGMDAYASFEDAYIHLRQKEQRLFPDDIAKNLPRLPSGHPLKKEWRAREKSMQRLAAYLGGKPRQKTRILDLGCGNGWLSAQLSKLPDTCVTGLDVNRTELDQAADLFRSTNLRFVHDDIFRFRPDHRFDYIILGSCIQYFRDIGQLINQLLALLKENGEIHVIDSPWYQRAGVTTARQRSLTYFSSKNSRMAAYYFHHHWASISIFNPVIMYNPRSLVNRVRRRLLDDSPFPWIRIIHGKSI